MASWDGIAEVIVLTGTGAHAGKDISVRALLSGSAPIATALALGLLRPAGVASGSFTGLRLHRQLIIADVLDRHRTGGTIDTILQSAVNGPLFLSGGAGTDELVIDDSGDASGDHAVLVETFLSGLGLAEGIDYRDFAEITVRLGTGDDTFFVEDTHLGKTSIRAGEGADTVEVERIRGETFIDGSFGDDTITVNRRLTFPRILAADDPAFDPALNIEPGVNPIGAVLTLDGRDGTDLYTISLAGQGSALIKVIDHGDAADGTDALVVNGTALADFMLLRANNNATGFIASFTQDETNDGFEAVPPVLPGDRNIERINYNANINAGVTINLLSGDDEMVIDDVAVVLQVSGGIGDDSFQIGQLFDTMRVGPIPSSSDVINPTTGLSDEDAYATIETTRGFLSNGISESALIDGGAGNDRFDVLHNLAPLSLRGGDGDDVFVVRSFALAGSQDNLRERTDISGGGGADLIQYAVNAPVTINGGDGFDTVIIIGTEFADDFVVTQEGVFGAGRDVTFTEIESLTLDGAEGDDRFFVLGTQEGVLTEIAGGLGADTFVAGGDTPPVVSNDLRGHSGLILHSVESVLGSGDTGAFDGINIEGIAAEVVDDDEPAIAFLPIGPLGEVQVLEGGAAASYAVVMSRRPDLDVVITVSPIAPTVEDRAKDFRNLLVSTSVAGTFSDAITLTFTPGNWDTAQTVWVKAVEDTGAEGSHFAELRHSVLSQRVYTDRAGSIENATSTTVEMLKSAFTDLHFADKFDKLIGARFEITDGTGEGQSAIVTAVATTANTVTLTLAEEFVPPADPARSSWQVTRTDAIKGIGVTNVVDTVEDQNTNFGVQGDVEVAPVLLGKLLEVTYGDSTTETFTIIGSTKTTVTVDGAFTGTMSDAGSATYRILDGLTVLVVEGHEFSGVLTGTAQRTVNDGDAALGANDGLRGVVVEIIAGTGAGQSAIIVASTATQFTVDRPWALELNTTSIYSIHQYNDLKLPNLTASIIDNDATGVAVVKSEAQLDAIEGKAGGDTYDAFLTREPDAFATVSVTLTPLADDFGVFQVDLSATPTPATRARINANGSITIEFTLSNWSTPVSVTATAIDDSVIEGPQFTVITHTAASAVDVDVFSTGFDAALLSNDETATDTATPPSPASSFTVHSTGTEQSTLLLTDDVVVNGGTTVVDASVITVQTVTIDPAAIGGTFFLTYNGERTANLSFDVTSATIESALTNLPTVGLTAADEPNIVVGRNVNVLTLTFANGFANPVAIQADGSGLLTLATSAVDSGRDNVVVSIDGNPLAQGRYTIVGNVLTFLSDLGAPEFASGLVEVTYDRLREGFDGFIGENLTVEVADNDAPGVLIEESGGRTTVIEGRSSSLIGGFDTYTVRLTKQPAMNESVTIRLRPEDTRTSRGPIAYFDTQVAFVEGTGQTLEADGTLLLTFDDANWFTPQTVTVIAKDDSVIDGGDTKAFADFPNVLNRIRGPLLIDGEGGQGSLAGLSNPVLMPDELDERPKDGDVVSVNPDGTQITVAQAELPAHILADMANILQNLINRTLTLAEERHPFEGEFRLITDAVTDGLNVVLTVNEAFSDISAGVGFAITDNSLNFFVNEEDQLDWLTAINEDSIRDELGVLTATRITGFGMTPDVAIAGRHAAERGHGRVGAWTSAFRGHGQCRRRARRQCLPDRVPRHKGPDRIRRDHRQQPVAGATHRGRPGHADRQCRYAGQPPAAHAAFHHRARHVQRERGPGGDDRRLGRHLHARLRREDDRRSGARRRGRHGRGGAGGSLDRRRRQCRGQPHGDRIGSRRRPGRR